MEPVIVYPFALDNWQKEAINAIHNEKNVLVTAKTGSGKTLVGEYQIAYSLSKEKRVFYTTPIKSLTNQKYHDLKYLFPKNSVGIMTGDIKSNPEADIVVMTTEILRNLLFKQNTTTSHIGTAGQLSLNTVDAVIFDEVHYINDPERGHVWEETLILLPKKIHCILLSATIDSAKQFADWLSKAKQVETVLLQTTHRIVPLIHGIFDKTKTPLPLIPLKMDDEAPYMSQEYQSWLRQRKNHLKNHDVWKTTVKNAIISGDSLAGSTSKVTIYSFTHQLNECIETLKCKELLPALFFSFSRKECERYAEQVTHTLIDSSDAASIKHIINFHLHKYDEQLRNLPQYHQILKLLQKGIAFHHSGVLPLLKEIIELLFSRGFIKILFCTETFAVGLNMPARTVIFTDLKKPDSGGGFRPLRPDEYIQMAGRAGRRGKDTQGVVLYLPSRNPVEPEEMSSILSGRLQPLTSRIQFHYDFILKSLHASQNDTPIWDTVLDDSYFSAQEKHAIELLQSEYNQVMEKINAIKLTEAQEAELNEQVRLKETVANTTNALRKKALIALERWNERHVGPVWKAASIEYIKKQELTYTCKKLQEQMVIPSNNMRVTPVLSALTAWEAVKENKLTTFGLLCTEVNEANPLLMAKLYESQLLKSATPEEITTVLGSFIVDKEALDKSVHPNELNLTSVVTDSLLKLDCWGRFGMEQDDKYYISSSETYWNLSTLWICIAREWLSGEYAAQIIKKYDIYEGNLMRGLHKLANLVNEWNAMATIVNDVDMLHKMESIPTRILRDIAIPESLYLRL
jgi:superfamily II RNA helicase